jgi:hypothetical protein
MAGYGQLRDRWMAGVIETMGSSRHGRSHIGDGIDESGVDIVVGCEIGHGFGHRRRENPELVVLRMGSP